GHGALVNDLSDIPASGFEISCDGAARHGHRAGIENAANVHETSIARNGAVVHGYPATITYDAGCESSIPRDSAAVNRHRSNVPEGAAVELDVLANGRVGHRHGSRIVDSAASF